MNMKQLVLLLLFFFPAIILAQTSGIVVDSKSGKPIAYANMVVENQNIGTTSDEKGQFSIKEIFFCKKLSSLKLDLNLSNPSTTSTFQQTYLISHNL